MITPALALILLSTAAAGAAAPVATYRGGEVSADEYAGWLHARGLKDEPERRREYAEQVALAKALAAIWRGLRGTSAIVRLRA